jgi:ribosome-binding protein aMBF1 (putative translation factor)
MPGSGKRKPAKIKPSHQQLGLAIREARSEAGLTQAQLAKKTEHQVSYLSELENGKRNPTWTVLAELSRALKIRLAELVERAEAQ